MCALFISRNLLCQSVVTEISRRKKKNNNSTVFNIRNMNLSSPVLLNRINFTITCKETISFKNTILSYLRSRWLDINAKAFLFLCFFKSSGSHSDINSYSIGFCIAKQTVYVVLQWLTRTKSLCVAINKKYKSNIHFIPRGWWCINNLPFYWLKLLPHSMRNCLSL